MRRSLLVPCLASRICFVAWLGVLGFLCSLTFGQEAQANAQPRHTYAIVNIQIAGDAEPALRSQIEAAILRGLKDAGMGRVSLTAVEDAARGKPELVGCVTTTCLEKLGRLVGATRFLLARVVTSGATYNVELEILASRDNKAGKQVASCTACTMSELGSLIGQRTRELVTARTAQVELSILSHPDRAEITLRRRGGDSAAAPEKVGKAPLKLSLAPGAYIVEARLPDHLPVQQVVELEDAGDVKSVELTLVRGTRDETPTTGRPFRWLKWGAAGAAGAIVATGAVFLVLDGNPNCNAGDEIDHGQCPAFYNTDTLGWGGIAGGLVVGGVSGWMFWRDARSARDVRGSEEARMSLRLVPTGRGAALSLEF